MSANASDIFRVSDQHLDWAKEASTELYAILTAYFEGDITASICEVDPKTGEDVMKCKITKPIPTAANRKATEALVNIRHAFDQITYAAVSSFTTVARDSINFPWSTSPKDLEGLLKRRGIPTQLFDCLRKCEPYPASDSWTGGDSEIRAIATLINNKHTIGLGVTGSIAGIRHNFIVRARHFALRTQATWDPVKNEIEIARCHPGGKLTNYSNISFQVVLSDPVLPKPVNAVHAIERFRKKAEQFSELAKAACGQI